ncbi:Tor2p [Rhizophagus irregularis DAOM 197198w]|uniref:Serine/threonine-protein kinase TOR n=1 Tax=Rhizophagus irregularis (strain DAOM 197198w) TaxID=1432141 RepID=A0A015K3X5_RHIIW|nr:Tor2p [Rhizophagus irregularis DAOM 197198w]
MDDIINRLKNKDKAVQQKAALELRLLVEGQPNLLNEANKRIFELMQGDTPDKIGGILAIDSLINNNIETTTLSRFTNYLKMVLPSGDQQIMILASKALGKLAAPSGAVTAIFVSREVNTALEYLQGDRNESRRYAAALVLRELAQNAPTLIYTYVSSILDNIWVGLRDQKQIIREASAETLSACLKIVYERESSMRIQWYTKIYDEASRNLKPGNADQIHGALLAYRELLHHAKSFMHERYKNVCETVLRYKDHRDGLIRRTVISLIPVLAEFDNKEFVATYVHKCMLYLLAQLKKERDRSISFIAIGQVAIAVGSNIGPYLDGILSNIKEGLTPKARNRGGNEAPLFQCIGMLARAVGQALTMHMHELLDLMFACGLSEPLRQALMELAVFIPPLLPNIQERLLNMLSTILSGQTFRAPGSPASEGPDLRRHLKTDISEMKDVETVTLALKTLGSFNFEGHILNEFVRDCVVRYLEQDNHGVREAAALTCCQLFARDPILDQTSNHAILVVNEVLEKLLTVGVADPDPNIRETVLKNLNERFDKHLAQAENIRSLFLALNDEIFTIREITITIIGRLASHNPAYVMPSLRKTLIQLLTELEYSSVSRNKEESARLLSLLVSASQRLIKPYVESILKALLPRSRDPNPAVASSVLAALGELARVGGEDLTPYLDNLMPLIIDALQDQSSTVKRDAALKTLGQLTSNTGFVIEPYQKYPQLLSILINILKTEQSPSIRRETVKLVGILGALDPYRHKITIASSEDSLSDPKTTNTDVTLLMIGLGPSSEDYYPTVVINALMKILRDSSLNAHHTAVIEAVMYIFKTLSLKCVPFLPQITPAFLGVMRTCPSGMLEFYFQQLGILVSIVQQHIRNYLSDIFALVENFWNPSSTIQITIINLVEEIAKALDGEFKNHLPVLLPIMLQIFDQDKSEKRQPTLKVLHALVVFGTNIEEYMHLVIPVVVKLFEKPDVPLQLRKAAVQTIGSMSKKVNFSDHASRIIHPLARVLALPYGDLRIAAMETLCALVFQLGSDYAIFIPMINKVILKHRIQNNDYEILVSKLLKGEPLPQEFGSEERFNESRAEETPAAETNAKKLPVNQQHLKNAWECSQRSTKDDWHEWIRRLSVELLKESPSHALRACASLAGVYHQLARELFNAGFISCWSELYYQYKDELVSSLMSALRAPNIPAEIVSTILNLAEFMEHYDKPLPIDIKTLGNHAENCHAYAKALHYKELEFISEASTETIEKLIQINNQLQLPDAAIGILTHAQQNPNLQDLQLKENWYEKLNRWEDALTAYEKRRTDDPNDFEATLGVMRCLHSLGNWDGLSELVQEKWPESDITNRKSMATFAAAGAWSLGQWSLMEDYIENIKPDNYYRPFYQAIIALHKNQYSEAVRHIDKTRDLLDTELTALVGESYNRAYNVVVRVQMLAELEEIITYKQYADQPDRQATIRKTWMKRLKGCQRNVDVWQQILKVRTLVISPKENMEMWIKFANLCRKSDRLELAEKTLRQLLVGDQKLEILARASPQVVYAHLKWMWASGVREEALGYLRDFTTRMSNDHHRVGNTGLLARCCLKKGEWQKVLQDDWDRETIPDILQSYLLATQYDKEWYKAWHAWALANFEVISFYEKSNSTENNTPADQNITVTEEVNGDIHQEVLRYVVPSVQGFFKSIALSRGNCLQDTLRLLTLWFKYGYQEEVCNAIKEGFSNVNIDTWLEVIPQLIARIHAPNQQVRRLIHDLLAEVGKEHPQALIYPLTVASKSPSSYRQTAAESVMDKLRAHSAVLVDQALLVSQELIRVAILWHEIWMENLEEASRLFFIERNFEAMFNILDELQERLDRGPETLREVAFVQAYGRELQEAGGWCKKYKQTGDMTFLSQAWQIYHEMFKKITAQVGTITTLELQYVSPKLLAARDLELAVPGCTYKSGEPVTKIASFISTVNIISSKQRPRKLNLIGNDGKEYQFLLKGHEDLRQDERVMQLFGLVNTLLSVDSETFKRHLHIQRYTVTPLTPNIGLLGWVPNCDTLHALIRDYRESKKILLNIEHRLMLQMAPDYDQCTIIEKVEVFEFALANTTGQDLYKVLWLKSKNSEAWLERRTNYTRSLALMSMVGYILGLGDRHPSNIMLDRYTGKIVHIDFGDCFEVAMTREKYPEKIPFRLTRMLVNAMEVSGIEGNFRTTCEAVMSVLRKNKESLMAGLEAFVHDPLINWRIMANPSPRQDGENMHAVAGSSNRRARDIINRISNKLTGKDFKPNQVLDVPSQVEKLIQQAISVENLCQCYIGWCAFW